MGNNQMMPKKDDKKEKKKKQFKKPEPSLVHMGKKKKKQKGVEVASKLPNITPTTKCLLRMRKLERVKDYLLMEEEFIKSQNANGGENKQAEEETQSIEMIRGSPVKVGTLMEIITEDHAIVECNQSEYYVRILSIVDKEQLELNCSVLLRDNTYHIVGVLSDEADPLLGVMKVDKGILNIFNYYSTY
ncbi:MAG: hypothetical protein MJ252_26010 [archaeon]|nr:hypothetical protein [archaeon]